MLVKVGRPSPFPPITSLQPQSFHSVTRSLAQRRSTMFFRINVFRTLSIATGVVPPSSVSVLPHHGSPLHHSASSATEIDSCSLARRCWKENMQIHIPSELALPFNALFRHSMHGNTIQRKVWSRTANSGKLFFVTEGLQGQSKLGA